MGTKQTFLRSLIDELGTPLVRFLSGKVKNEDDARDLAQEAFLRIYRLEEPQKLTNAKAFLFQTASNLAIDQLRHAKLHSRYLETEARYPGSEPEDEYAVPSAERTAAAQQQLQLIFNTIEELPANCRRAFLLHRGRDMTYGEIARELGVSTSMVEKYIIQALRQCRMELQKQEISL
jgi:RNA polymerase sigma-70 factor (ECF subfamily)|tara:strand:+ start:1650 stop:2180 length:531 start_codon:yes stop_codon:yes gene_type:complete